MKVSQAEANYQNTPKKLEKCSICTMFRAPKTCTAVTGDISPSGWCKFFESALGKAQTMAGEFHVFLPIGKVNKEKRTVSGYASTPTRDSDGEIVTLEAIRNALPDYMAYGNIREMHALKAVGVAQEANIDTKGLFLTGKIVDNSAWDKCLEGVYKGFSIGGRKINKEGDKITEIELTEISVVDRPANPDCRISIAKSEKTRGEAEGYLVKPKVKLSPEQKALKKMAKVVGDLAKTNPPAAHDGFSLPAKKNDGDTLTEAAGEPKVEKTDGEPSKPYGNVEYADPGYQSDKKKRYPVDTEEHIRAAWSYINKGKNAAKYTPEDAAKVKAKIVSAWKSTIDKSGPPSAKEKDAKKLMKVRLKRAMTLGTDSFLVLKKPIEKGMSSAGSLAYCFDTLRDTQRSLMLEAKREGGDQKDSVLAKQLGNIAKQLAAIISQKAEHEGSEALDLSDANDQYLLTILGDDKMAGVANNGGDAFEKAMADLIKRAATPTKAQRLEMAKGEVSKARKAMKECRKAIEDAHKMHKAAYLSKAAKKNDKPKEDDDGDFDHAGAMEKLNKAYEAASKARTFGKAAVNQIAKAEGRSGQRGQEAGDPEPGFYEVPAGVKDLTPASMAGAAPGTSGGASQPPAYPDDGSVYPGKAMGIDDLAKYAKDGQIPAAVAELIIQKAKAEGELEALRRVPTMPTHGRRPFAFDTTRITGGTTQGSGDLNKALFDGVNVADLSSQDEMTHTQASAKVIGNFIQSGHFGKSVFDPAFKGAAGSAR